MSRGQSRSGPAEPRSLGVIGSGVSGLVAAYVATTAGHRVTMFEADDRLGGHADTHQVAENGRSLAIDTGFIVHNRHTYPILTRLFAELGIGTRASEMSLSVRSAPGPDGRVLEWAGALGPRGLFPRFSNVTDRHYLRMLTEIPRFHRMAKAVLANRRGRDGDDSWRDRTEEETLAEFLEHGRFSAYFQRNFVVPLVAAVWSCDPDHALEYPAAYLFTFLDHHGMLRIFGSPEWRTVEGGSARYVAAIAERLDTVHAATPVRAVEEHGDHVSVTDDHGTGHRFDSVVIATHPDQALALLAHPSPVQREVLGAIPYTVNPAVLHTDITLLPEAPRAWACWNHRERHDQSGLTVTYDLTRLMGLDTPVHYLVTLGGDGLVDPESVIDRMDYAHPRFTQRSVLAARRVTEIETDRVTFAGAWQGWGFHEDGARSGVRAIRRLGIEWPADSGPRPGLYSTRIAHTRRSPWRHHFDYRSSTWLVDLDDLPDHGIRARFEARDHIGDPTRSIRANVIAFAAAHRVDVSRTRILMAAHARAFGFCFNPISVFWCLDEQGRSVATILEVHNTYGDRHAYLVHPDDSGYAVIDKAMYVSPFHGVDGAYEVYAPVPSDRVRVAIRLHVEGSRHFSASLVGERSGDVTDIGARELLRSVPDGALGAARIRKQGIALWLRGLPRQARPHHQRQKGT